MLNVQNTLSQELTNKNNESNELSSITASQFLYGETDVPFISFFKTAFVLGIFTNLGDLLALKEKNTLYASYIDRWVADCIRFKLIKVLEGGDIEICFKLSDYPEEIRFNKYRTVVERSKNIVEKVVQIATQQLSTQKADKFASNNIFVFKNHPKITNEARKIYQDFYEKMQHLSKESDKIELKDYSGLKYIGLTSCTITKEVLHDL